MTSSAHTDERSVSSRTTSAAGASNVLTGRMGAGSLALTVLAFSAPLAVVCGMIPQTLIYGGQGATFAFLAATVILMFFAVGFVAMAKHVPKPGDFYAFISSGLGNTTGLAAAFLSVVSYITVFAGACAFLGVATNGLLTSVGIGAPPWWVWSIIGWAVVGTLGYFHIDLSAKILSIAMVFEVVLVMAFNIAVAVRGGAEGYALAPVSPTEFARGDIGIVMLFAIMVFLGFEATALFRDEVRDPNRTIPRATYGAVLFVGVLYALSCYMMTTAFGSKAVDVALEAPADMFPNAIGEFITPAFTQITFFFVITSQLASLIAIHNVLSRYVHNLGCDGALPVYLSTVHERHGSPHRASIAITVLVAIIIAPFVIANVSGDSLYGRLIGVGSVGLLVLMTAVCAAVIVWFARTGIPEGENRFKVFVAPAVAGLALAVTVVLAVKNFELVSGGQPGENTGLLIFLALFAAAGALLAVYFRFAKPHIYAALGRASRAYETDAPADQDSAI